MILFVVYRMCSTMESTSRLPFGVSVSCWFLVVASFSWMRMLILFISCGVKVLSGSPSVVLSMSAMRSMRRSSWDRFSISVCAWPTDFIWRMYLAVSGVFFQRVLFMVDTAEGPSPRYWWPFQ